MSGDVRLSGQIPSGEVFETRIEHDLIALRVGEQVCVTHPDWMSFDRARRTAAALLAVLPPSARKDQEK